MSGQIRKISVGKDYPDGVLHYQIDKNVKLNKKYYVITDIIQRPKKQHDLSKVFDIFIANDDGKIIWKTITDVPVVVEYNIDFE